jgi:hypothetical protein
MKKQVNANPYIVAKRFEEEVKYPLRKVGRQLYQKRNLMYLEVQFPICKVSLQET